MKSPAETWLPLLGITVADFSASAGADLLADLGAEVIAVEAPGAAPRSGKPRSVAVDVANPASHKIVERLCAKVDVVIGSGAIDFEALKRHNSALIYCSGRGTREAIAMAVLGGLYQKSKSGRGARIELGLLEGRSSIAQGPTRPGQHSREILVELGFDDAEIADLIHAGAVAS